GVRSRGAVHVRLTAPAHRGVDRHLRGRAGRRDRAHVGSRVLLLGLVRLAEQTRLGGQLRLLFLQLLLADPQVGGDLGGLVLGLLRLLLRFGRLAPALLRPGHGVLERLQRSVLVRREKIDRRGPVEELLRRVARKQRRHLVQLRAAGERHAREPVDLLTALLLVGTRLRLGGLRLLQSLVELGEFRLLGFQVLLGLEVVLVELLGCSGDLPIFLQSVGAALGLLRSRERGCRRGRRLVEGDGRHHSERRQRSRYHTFYGMRPHVACVSFAFSAAYRVRRRRARRAGLQDRKSTRLNSSHV